MPSDQKQLIEQIKLQYSSLGKALEKQTKTIEDQGEKQVKAIEKNIKQLLKSKEIQSIKDTIPEDKINKDAKNELNEIIETEKTIDRKKLIYKTKHKSYSSKNFRTIGVFCNDIYNGIITLEEADKDQSSLVNEINRFNSSTRSKTLEEKGKTKKIPFKI